MANWQARRLRARVAAALGTWFGADRWPGHDTVAAIAGFVLALTVFLPWFHALVGVRGSDVTGTLLDPPGDETGIAGHHYLWVAFGLGMLQCALLVARNAPGPRGLRLPFYREFQLVLSVITLAVVLVACVMKPPPWYASDEPTAPFYVDMILTFGAIAAVLAAVVSATTWLVVIRKRRRAPRQW